MADGWVGAPVDDQVRPIANLTERTGRFPHLLERHDGRSMAEGCRGIDVRTQCIRQPYRLPLSLRATAGESVNQRSLCRFQYFRRLRNRSFQTDRPACDFRLRRQAAILRQQPRLSQVAGSFRSDNPSVFHRQLQIITYAPADGAGDVFEEFGRIQGKSLSGHRG